MSFHFSLTVNSVENPVQGEFNPTKSAQVVRSAAIAVNQTPLDFTGNRTRIEAALLDARAQKVTLACFPELSITGYGCQDYFFYPEVLSRALESLKKIAALTEGIAAVVGLPLSIEGTLYNAAALCCDRKLHGFFLKKNLANDGLHYERRWFKPWQTGMTVVQIENLSVPAGDLIFEFSDGVRVGSEICEDAWMENKRPAHALACCSADIIVNPSASHFAFEKYAKRKHLVTEGSALINGGYIYANLLGNESGRTIFDGDTLIAHQGVFLAAGERFSFQDRVLTLAEIPIRENSKAVIEEGTNPKLSPSPGLTKVPMKLSDTSSPFSRQQKVPDKMSALEEFGPAVSLGLLDYLRKSGSRGFSLSLSGGADSGAVLVLCGLMFSRAFNELTDVERNLKLPFLSTKATLEDVLKDHIHCVYQSTENSGEITQEAAQAIARAIGAKFSSISVQKVVDQYEEIVSELIGRKTDWAVDDIAKQNIQARVRMPVVWYIANLENFLLLCTSNRSEGSVGYATMDGDLAGSIAPLAGVSKTFILNWLRYVQNGSLTKSFHSIPELELITRQSPTAELKPATYDQTDEGDLMPYEVLSSLEQSFLLNRNSAEQCSAELIRRFSEQYDAATITKWCERFFKLWGRSQWKRERAPISFHLDEFSVDPKGWARFPVLSHTLVD